MPLLERERCLDDLGGWLAEAAAGRGCVALVGGEAGIGKTALLQEFAAARQGTRVLWGGCDDLFTPRPLAPLHDIARQAGGALRAAFAAQASRAELFAAALDELERTPCLAVLEDMHWADGATLDLLKFLGRRIRATRSMIIATYRDDEVAAGHPLRLVIGDLPRASTHRLFLAPLSEAAVAQLARRAGRPAQGLHGITGGNPLFVTEVLAAGAGQVPASVRDSVLGRAARLAPAARELAEFVCVVPGRAEPWLLAQADLADPARIEQCLAMGMVLAADGALCFRHELVRRALEDSLLPHRRQALHAKVLAALATRPEVPSARLVHHAGGARDGASVLRFAPLAAAQAAAVGAHVQAAAHLEAMAPYAASLEPRERARVLEQLAYESHLIGDPARAMEARREALELWRTQSARLEEGDNLRWLSRHAWFLGERVAATRYCVEAIGVLESLPPSAQLARAYCDRADLCMEAHDNEAAIEFAGRAIALAPAADDKRILCDASSVTGTARLILGNAAGWADLERGLRLALAGGFQEQVASAYTDLSAMSVSRRDYAQAARYLASGLAYCEERDLDFLRPYMLAYRARMKLEQGDWSGAGEDVEAVLRNARTTPVTRMPALRTLGLLRIRRGDPDASSPLVEARALAGTDPELQQFGTLAAIDAEEAWLRDDREGVIRAALPAYERVSRHRDPRMKGELAAWLYRANALAEVPGDAAEPYAQELAGHWQAAAEAWERLGCPYDRAVVLGCHGGPAQQREAFAIFEHLGAAPAAQALRRRMRSAGLRGVPRGLRASTQRDPFGLTRREAQVLALMCQGLGNAAIARRLFLSTRTVDHHVSAVLAKLGVATRAQAVEAARRRGTPQH